MILFPLTRTPSFSTQISERKRLAVLTKRAEGRAWRPSRFLMASSLEILMGGLELGLVADDPMANLFSSGWF